MFGGVALAQTPNGIINAPIYATGYITQVGGATVTTRIAANSNHPTNLNIYASGAIINWNINLPNPGFEGQVLSFACSASVTTIAISTSDGSTVDSNAPTSCTTGGSFAVQYDPRGNIWRLVNSSSSGGGGGGTPGGANTQVQFNNSGAFGGSANFAWDNTNNVLTLASSLTGAQATNTLLLSPTWNTTGVPAAFKVNVTDTASATNSLLADLQVGSASKFSVNKLGFNLSGEATGLTLPTTAFGNVNSVYNFFASNQATGLGERYRVVWAANDVYAPVDAFIRSGGTGSGCTLASPCASTAGGSAAAHEYYGYVGPGGIPGAGGFYNDFAMYAIVEAGQWHGNEQVTADILGQYQIAVANGNSTVITNGTYPGFKLYSPAVNQTWAELTNGVNFYQYNTGLPSTNIISTSNANREFLEGYWSGNQYFFGTNKTGTGVQRSIILEGATFDMQVGGASALSINASKVVSFTGNIHGPLGTFAPGSTGFVTASGLLVNQSGTATPIDIGYTGGSAISAGSAAKLQWMNNTDTQSGTADLVQTRAAAGVLKLTGAGSNGAALELTGYTFSTLPTGAAGMIVYITDGSAVYAAGATISAGGGANKVYAYFDGTNWKALTASF